MKYILSVVLVAVTIISSTAAACLVFPSGDGDSWEVTMVDGSGDVGDHSSIAIQTSGYPAISYFDQANLALKFAWQDGDGWHNTTVDSDGHVGEYTSLVILPSGSPAISYHDVDRDDLKYAWLDGDVWRITIVDGDNGGYTGPTGTSLAILPSGHPAISYRDHWNGWLKYAWFDGDDWNTTFVDDKGNLGHNSSLAILPSGHPAISYVDTTKDQLMYAWFDGSVWQKTSAAQPGGTNTRLIILPSGQPAIVHDAAGGIQYVWFDGETWSTTTVDTVEGYESWFGYAGFALKPSGDPALSYVRRQAPYLPVLTYAWLEDGSWVTTSVIVGGSATSSLAFLPSGQPAISYRDAGRLWYATQPATSTTLTSFDIVTGVLLDGTLSDIESSDNLYVHTRSGFGQTVVDLHNMEMIVSAVTTVDSATTIDLTIESRIDEPAGLAQIRMRNWNTNQFEQAGSYSIGNTDNIDIINDINATNYIDGSGNIDLSIKHLVFVPFLAFTFESFLDQVEITVN